MILKGTVGDFFTDVRPVIDYSVRNLCIRPYPGHPKGCPNYGKKLTCPPQIPFIERLIDLNKEIYVIWNVFDFGHYLSIMKRRHPDWSERQLACCLYWQGTARKELKLKIGEFLRSLKRWPRYEILITPEAAGVDITATMKTIGIDLEWPPRTKAYQIALVGWRGEVYL